MKPTSRRLRRQASAPRTGLASTSPEFGETPLPILEAQAPKCYRPPPLFGYAHRLQGFDTDWVESDAARRSASYSNLASGEYVLQVRSTNRARVWIEDELSFGIRVLPA